jgi:alpha-methylacyl-CoA racemase
VPPLNLVGDFGGGGMFLAFGVMCAVYEAQRSGKGQVVDVSMVEGAAALMHMMYGMKAEGAWRDERGSNLLDGGTHFYDTYETADGKFVSIGSIEPQFYRLLLELAGLDPDSFAPQLDASRWGELTQRMATVFRSRTRAQWCEIMEGTDVCFAPVLSLDEAPAHPQNLARGTFVGIDGVLQPAPAPRFSRTAPVTPEPPHPAGSDADTVLRQAGYTDARIRELRESGALT